MSKQIDRRNFLKIMGTGAATASIGVLVSCNQTEKQRGVVQSGHYSGEVPTDKMTYRTTPTTGDKVSLLGYGCMRWPTTKDAEGKTIIDQETVNELVDYALAHGVNYFDTAPVYVQGLSEKATGIALKRHPRESFFIATKMSNHRPVPEWRTLEGAKKLYYDSMKNLQVDYIDYYLLHAVGNGGIADLKSRFFDNGLLDFLLKEREAGRIRNLGWSFHGEVEVFDYLLSRQDEFKWDFVQIQMNYLDWKFAKEVNTRNVNAEYLYTELEKRNIPAVIMEPLLGGRLARLNEHSLVQFKQLRPDDSPATWAFRYAGTPKGILTVLSGMVYMEHLQENIRTFAPLDPVTTEEEKVLQEIAERMVHSEMVPCTECQYCMPCPYGVDIPGTFSHYNKLLNDNLIANNGQDPHYRKARRAFLVGYDRKVEKLRQASHCIGCKKCLPKCPQGIPIIEHLHKIDAYAEKLRQEKL